MRYIMISGTTTVVELSRAESQRHDEFTQTLAGLINYTFTYKLYGKVLCCTRILHGKRRKMKAFQASNVYS